MHRPIHTILAGLILATPLLAADEPTKEPVSKLKDGWYAVDFQVGAGKVHVELPGEPKLESDPKAVGERLYSVTTAQKRRYFIRVLDGHDGGILPDKDSEGLSALGIVDGWKKNDPKYKDSRHKVARINEYLATQIILEKAGSQQYAVVHAGCLVHVGIEGFTSGDEAKRFFASLKLEKGKAVIPETPKVEVPTGWIEHTKAPMPYKVYAPIQLTPSFRRENKDFGDYAFLSKNEKNPAFEVRIHWAVDAERLEGFRGNINAMVPAQAAKVTIGGIAGVCTLKDGKPVGKNDKFEYFAFVDNVYVKVINRGGVSNEDAEKVASLIAQQLKK